MMFLLYSMNSPLLKPIVWFTLEVWAKSRINQCGYKGTMGSLMLVPFVSHHFFLIFMFHWLSLIFIRH
jgi:hypothetical protein